MSLADHDYLLLAHQTMAFFQLPRQMGQDLPLAQALNPAEDFGREALSLYACYSRKHPPVQCQPLAPIAIVILDQVAAGLHRV